MSIVWSNSDGWILCHSAYLHELYKTLEHEQTCIHCGKYDIFHIHSPFLKQGQKHQDDKPFFSTDEEAKSDEVMRVYLIFQRIMNKARKDGVDYFNRSCPRVKFEDGNITAVSAVNHILNNSTNLNSEYFHGENINQYSICAPFCENDYFLPPLCKFFSCPVKDFEEKFRRHDSCKFDVILLDPPWWNKHVRRKNARSLEAGYKMMYNEELSEVPIDSLLGSNGLVIIWCTNSHQHINNLITKIFHIWNVEYVCSWYWMKVTEDGKPICKLTLEVGKKKPFERIIFGARRNRCKELKMPEPDKVIVSVPSAIHSHKPPLASIVSEYIPSNARCLEIFARYLLPNWISTGNEVFKLQQKMLFIN